MWHVLPPALAALGATASTSPVGLTDWFYSPGFGGFAAVVAASIAYLAARHNAATTLKAQREAAFLREKSEEADRFRRCNDVRRDLRAYTVNAFKAARYIMLDAKNLYRSTNDLRNLMLRIKEPDIPGALTELRELAAAREVAAILELELPTLDKPRAALNEAEKEFQKMLGGFIAMSVAVLLHHLDGSEDWLASLDSDGQFQRSQFFAGYKAALDE